MPFMGRDWRSPGEAWVKTETLGWQRMKIIEYQLDNDVGVGLESSDGEDSPRNQSASPTRTNSSSPTARQQCQHDNGRLSPGSSCDNYCCCSSSNQLVNGTNGRHPHHHHLVTDSAHQPKTAPHCRISVRTREVAMHNTISEAFYRLDFYNAIHDIRRFNYICKLLHLLITQNLTSLSGCATRVLFTMLEQVAWEVSANKRNINVIRNLLAELKQTIQKYYCWGRPIGSSLLWQQHFETIERISQIVDEIELSPPNNDKPKVTFDMLPVEMIREILLRLNDYRDLVNSAQASPVMRTMIDNQCIWQKLCRYHFTDQQLKLAFESNKFNFVKKQQNTQLRGIKYARTTSADGRSSYRSPVVAHKRNSLTGTTTNKQTDRQGQQSEQTNDDRRTDPHANPTANPDCVSNPEPSSTSSYVTNTVRKFNQECPSSLSVSQRATCPRRSSERFQRSSPSSSSSSNGQVASTNDTNRSAVEIDWERVFHQLRKTFDLKEEYADCLLLCRHCRCLFWKSFGHPCIKNDEPTTNSLCCQQSNSRQNFATKSGSSNDNGRSNNNDYDCDSCNQSNERTGQSSLLGDGLRGGQGAGTAMSGRISVALLSRNLDRQALVGDVHESATNNENILVAATSGASYDGVNQHGQQQQASAALDGSASSQHLDNRRWPPSPPHLGARQPLNNLNVQLCQHNINRQRRQEWQQQGQQQQHNPRRLDVARDSTPRPADRRNGRGQELVPKHVTISPQAFLKFFSL